MKKTNIILSLFLVLIMMIGTMTCAFAADATETESNETKETANTFTAVITGEVENADDIDYVKFDVTNASLVTVKVSHINNTESDVDNLQAVVENTYGITESKLVLKVSDESKTATFAANAGTHYVKLTGMTVGKSDWKVEVSTGEAVLFEDETGGNNDISKTQVLPVISGDWLSNSKGCAYGYTTASDKDYFEITVPAAGYIYVDLQNKTENSGKVRCDVIAPIGSPVAREEVVGSVSAAYSANAVRSPRIYLKAGKYYLCATTSFTGFAQYTIDFCFVPSAGREAEYNNEKTYANELARANNSKIIASLGTETDVDYFYINITEATRDFDLNFAINSGDHENIGGDAWKVTITNVNGETVDGGSFVFSSSSGNKYGFENLPAGTYYVKVEVDGSYFMGSTYTITLTEKVVEKKMSFWDRVKAMDWSGFWNGNFAEWIKQIDYIKMFKAIFTSIAAVINIFA